MASPPASPRDAGVLAHPLPRLDDPEGDRVPAGLPPVVDAHVHVFPRAVFRAVWRWFDRHGWPIRYRLAAGEVVDHLLSRGVEQVVVAVYAHKAGIARELNAWLAGFCRTRPRVTGLAAIQPGEPGAARILEEAFSAGLAGVKVHCHVQCVAPDAPEMEEVHRACVAWGRPLLMHAGREPKSPAYACDPHELCGAARVARVLEAFPGLRLCVPHLGADEFAAHARLLERFDGLWLDTAMMLSGYLPVEAPERLVRGLLSVRPDRVLYGSDFPNVPYSWDRELRWLAGTDLAPEQLAALLADNARDLYGLSPTSE